MASNDPNITLLQAKNAEIVGIQNALENYPANLDTNLLPIILIWPRNSSWSAIGLGGIARGDIDYEMRIYTGPFEQGDSYDGLVQLTIQLWQALKDKWLAMATYLDTTGRVLQYEPIRVSVRQDGDEPFLTSDGYEVVDYPAGSEIYFHSAAVTIKLREEAIDGLEDCS